MNEEGHQGQIRKPRETNWTQDFGYCATEAAKRKPIDGCALVSPCAILPVQLYVNGDGGRTRLGHWIYSENNLKFQSLLSHVHRALYKVNKRYISRGFNFVPSHHWKYGPNHCPTLRERQRRTNGGLTISLRWLKVQIFNWLIPCPIPHRTFCASKRNSQDTIGFWNWPEVLKKSTKV